MRIGISNLLWEPSLDEAVARLLAARGIDAIDLAPTRYFDPRAPLDRAAARRIRAFWNGHGLQIIGLQSLLHGLPGLQLFGDAPSRAAMARRLEDMIELAGLLGASQLVFGSWQCRRRGALPSTDAEARAADFFAPLAARAHDAGCCVGIEPIHAGYGNDFLVDHEEAAMLVGRIASPGMGLVLDVGCAGLAGEDPAAIAARHGQWIRHVQLAERGLAPLDPANPWHGLAGPPLRGALAGRVACIEALTPVGDDPLAALGQSLDVADRWYR
jgi:D-psicose/D-tagatose/L-ribulose 3-epimerase